MKKSLLDNIKRNQEAVSKVIVNQIQDTIRTQYANLASNGNTKHTKAWQDYGYPDFVSFQMLYRMWERFGIATAGIELPVKYGWMDNPCIKEGSEDAARDEKTAWEIETAKFFKQKKLFKKLKGADVLNRIGDYSAFIVQVQSDNPDEIDWGKPLSGITLDKVLRFIPVNQAQLKPNDKSDPKSPRYPLPDYYTLNDSARDEMVDGSDQTRESVTIHYSRVIIFAEGADDDTLNGVPANRAGYNDLLNLEKISGAGAEGFWKSVAQKLVLSSGTGRAPEVKEREMITSSINDAMNGLDASMMVGGMEVSPLGTTLPSNYKDPFMNSLYCYSASVGIPATILIGQQTGRLASDEDGKHLAKMVNSRRENWQTEMIESVIDWLDMHVIDYDVPDEYCIEWSDLLESSMSEKIDMFDKLANGAQKFNAARMAGETLVTEAEAREVLGFAAEKKEEIIEFGETIEDDELNNG